MGWPEFRGKDAESKDFRFSYSPKRSTGRVLSLDWIQNILDIHTKEIAGDDWRFLIPMLLTN